MTFLIFSQVALHVVPNHPQTVLRMPSMMLSTFWNVFLMKSQIAPKTSWTPCHA